MPAMMKRICVCFVLLLLITVMVRDSLFHFNTDIIDLKRKHLSAQRHWNIGYTPSYVYYNSPIRYQSDLLSIKKIIEPGYALLSDRATSYYAAATLPVYVRNIHRHHGLEVFNGLVTFLQKGNLCYMEDPFHKKAALKYLQQDARLSKKNDWPALRYVLLNKDKKNSMLRQDCIAVKSKHLESSLLRISQLLYEGDYLNLYQLDVFSQNSLKF